MTGERKKCKKCGNEIPFSYENESPHQCPIKPVERQQWYTKTNRTEGDLGDWT